MAYLIYMAGFAAIFPILKANLRGFLVFFPSTALPIICFLFFWKDIISYFLFLVVSLMNKTNASNEYEVFSHNNYDQKEKMTLPYFSARLLTPR